MEPITIIDNFGEACTNLSNAQADVARCYFLGTLATAVQESWGPEFVIRQIPAAIAYATSVAR